MASSSYLFYASSGLVLTTSNALDRAHNSICCLSRTSADPFRPLSPSQCSPYHYKDKALLIGDAAHAMVPFYGKSSFFSFSRFRR